MTNDTNNPADLDNDGDVDNQDIAKAASNFTGPGATHKSPQQGDTDNDGDVDSIDLGTIFAAYTGPITKPDEIPAQDINNQINRHHKASIPAGSIIKGGIEFTSEQAIITVSGKGPRPIVQVPKDGDGLRNRTQRIYQLHVNGLAFHSTHRDKATGINIQLNGKDDNFAKQVEIIDCYGTGLDTTYRFVDDWARKQIEGTPGRIKLIFGLNISDKAYGSDTHSIGLRYDGLASGSVVVNSAFDRSGWLVEQDRNKRSHCIYGSAFGAPLAVCKGNVFSRAAANAAQFRSGCDRYEWNIATQCSLGPWINGGRLYVTNNVVLDQVDIGPQKHEGRGHGFIISGNRPTVWRNIAARRHGSMRFHPAFKGLAGNAIVRENYAVQWAADASNYEKGDRQYHTYGDSKSITIDPGVPHFTDTDKYLTRGRAQPYIETRAFIEECQRACRDAA